MISGPLSDSKIFSLLSSVADLVLPRICILCGRGLIEKWFCRDCLSGMEKIEGPMCTKCGLPFGSKAAGDHLCAECVRKRPPFVAARSAFFYKGSVAEAVQALKYSGISGLAVPLGNLIYERLGPFRGFHFVVPVPLHKKRLKQRRFNQSLLMARVVAKAAGLTLDYKSLRRVVHTGPQTGLKREERQKNVRRAFELTGAERFMDKKVLLIDDVYTTGATVKECARLLQRAGASVFVATLARAVEL